MKALAMGLKPAVRPLVILERQAEPLVKGEGNRA